MQHILHTAILHKGPAAIRYPRGQGVGIALDAELSEMEIGKGELLKEGDDILLLPVGNRVQTALDAATELEKMGISAAVINPRFVSPLDRDLILTWAAKTGRVITIEENIKKGGFGSAILELLAAAQDLSIKVSVLGLPDTFMEQGPQETLRHLAEIDTPAISQAAMLMVGRKDEP